MRHQKSGRKFGRNSSHRRAMMRNLVTSLIVHERVTTTDFKAKELRRVAERLVTKAARVSHLTGEGAKRLSQADRARLLHARRVASRHLRARATDASQHDVDVIWKLFEEIGPRFAERPGGYLRITKLPELRKGDAAPMSLVEFVVGPAEGGAAPEAGTARGAGAKTGGFFKGLLGGRKGAKAKPAGPPAAEPPEDDEDGDEDEDEADEDEGKKK